MNAPYCEFCHTHTGNHLYDCPTQAVEEVPEIDASRVTDPYDHTQPQPALWGSAFAPDADGNKKPVGEVPTTMIHSKR